MTDEPDNTYEDPFGEPHDEVDEGREWNWWLVVIPVVAVLVFTLVLLYGANVFEPAAIAEGVTLFGIVITGVVILAILAIIEIALLLGGRPPHTEEEEEPAPAPEVPAARGEEPPELEAVETDDELDGKGVLEVSRPPKWAVDAGVYATTYVEVDHDRVLRLEEIVALRP